MTNQLTSTDISTGTTVRPPPRAITSDAREQPMRPGGRRGWIVMAGSAALAATAVLGFAVAGDDATGPPEPKTEQRPAHLIVQDEMGAALADADVSDGSFETAEANRMASLRDHDAVGVQAESGTAARPGLPDGHWQPSQLEAEPSDGSFETAEANRMASLRDLDAVGGEPTAEGGSGVIRSTPWR